jgi:hypothetical protein
MFFYMRPNKLVIESRGLTASFVTATSEQDYINPLSGSITAISADTAAVVTSVGHGLTSGTKIALIGTNSTPILDGSYEVVVIDPDTFSVPVTTTIVGTTGAWIKQLDVIIASDITIPDHFATAEFFDIVQHISPNKIIHYDVPVNSINQAANSVSFPASLVPELVVGSHITIAEETVVPNIPTELHPILAQRVAVSCLEAMGDEQNKQSAERKLKQMEDNSMSFLDNRVEGAQIKIKSKSSTLTQTLDQSAKRNRRW